MNKLIVAGLVTSLVGLIAGCGTSSSNNSAGGSAKSTITIAYVNWPEDVAVSQLWKQLLTQKGYHVKLVSSSVAPAYVGVGQGSVSLFMDAWLPNTQGTYWNRIKSKAYKLSSWYTSPTKEGFVVPSYVNINSISQLKSHASEFNNQVIGIDPGAGEMALAQKAITSYHLPEKLVSSSSSGMLAALSKAESQHKPVVVTLWSPHWAFAKWHLKYLSDPKKIFGPSDHIYTIANNKFPKTHPKVAKWLKHFKLSQSQIGQLEADINKYPSSKINTAVNSWIKANNGLVKGWFK